MIPAAQFSKAHVEGIPPLIPKKSHYLDSHVQILSKSTFTVRTRFDMQLRALQLHTTLSVGELDVSSHAEIRSNDAVGPINSKAGLRLDELFLLH